jgi:MoaA/NifB/PqqE/SkfB family radical SAM enzyme
MKVVKENPDADFVIGGGEAILHRQIEDILSALRDNKTNYTLLSNCLEPDRLLQLIHDYDVPSLTISFDGLKHDEIRGREGNRVMIESFLWRLRTALWRNKPEVKLSYTLSTYNEHTFTLDMDYIKDELCFDKVYFCLAQQMELLKTGQPKFVVDNPADVVEPRVDMLYEKDQRLLFGEDRPCDSTSSVFTIYSGGEIVRCQSFKSEDILGNIYHDNFNEVVEAAYRKPFVCDRDRECRLVCQRRYD